MTKRQIKPASNLDLHAYGTTLAATLDIQIGTSAALTAAMAASSQAASGFKDTAYTAIQEIRVHFAGQIPTGNAAIQDAMHANYVKAVGDLFGYGNAAQAGKIGKNGLPAYVEGEVAIALREKHKTAPEKLASIKVSLSYARKVALAAWTWPHCMDGLKLQHAATNAASLLDTGKEKLPVPKGAKKGVGDTQHTDAKTALEQIIAVKGAGTVLAWVADLLAADAKYRKAHAVDLAAITALAQKV